MSEFPKPFNKSFIKRTHEILEKDKGPYDATLLINCLLGTLVVPKESLFTKIPETPITKDWGISPEAITRVRCPACGHMVPDDIRKLVRCLRNAIAHFSIEPIHHSGKVLGFKFIDRSGFEASFTLEGIKTFISKLGAELN